MNSLSRFQRVAERTISRFLSRAVILLYHRVTDISLDPQLLCVSPAHFEEQLSIIKKHYRLMDLTTLARAISAKQIPERAVVITFDDGYADNLLFAKPLLEAFDAPATVFVTTAYIGKDREFWWDELERLLLTPDSTLGDLQLGVGNDVRCWSTNELVDRKAAYEAIQHWIRPMAAEARDSIINQLYKWADDEGHRRASHRILNAEELGKLGQDGLVEIGAHTRHHVSLAAQPTTIQRIEIAGSKDDIEQWLNKPVLSFSYPYGAPRIDYNQTTLQLVREADFKLATANFASCVTRVSDMQQLPRFLVRDWDGNEFFRRLEQFFA